MLRALGGARQLRWARGGPRCTYVVHFDHLLEAGRRALSSRKLLVDQTRLGRACAGGLRCGLQEGSRRFSGNDTLCITFVLSLHLGRIRWPKHVPDEVGAIPREKGCSRRLKREGVEGDRRLVKLDHHVIPGRQRKRLCSLASAKRSSGSGGGG